MISLDHMKSSEVRKAGDRSNSEFCDIVINSGLTQLFIISKFGYEYDGKNFLVIIYL